MRLSPLFLLCAFFCATPVLAQQESDDPALPDIAPREVEIRGQLEITLPALRRPAATGLLPQARLQPLPPLAPPGVQDVEPPAGAPQALPGGSTAPSGFADLPPPETGLLEAGAGRYFSRFGRGRLNLSLSPQWALRSRLDYDGTDGFRPFNEHSVETPADRLRGAVTLRTERAGLSASLSADGFLARHTLYGAERAPFAPSPVNEHPSRERYGGGAALHLETGGRVPLEVHARYDGAQVQTDVFESGSERFERAEQRFGASLKASASLAGTRAEADVQGSAASLTGGNDGFAGTVSFLDAGAGAWLLEGGPYRLFAGARLLTFSSEGKSGTYPAPDVRFSWQAAPQLSLYARTRPSAEANPLAGRYRENPSLLYEAAPQPTVRTVDAEAGVRFFPRRALELNAFAGYQHAPSFRFYEAAGSLSDGYARGVTAAGYAAARVLRAGGTISFRQTERLHASLSLAVRDGRLTGTGASIPYFAPVTARGLLSYGFLDGKGRLQLTGRFESARSLSRASEEQVGAFADLDVEGTYAVTPAIGVVVRLQNVPAGALERYDRYPRPPLVFETGLRVHL